MWTMIWPILTVVTSNAIYNICTKSTPQSVNGFASLTISYIIAAVCSIIMFFITSDQKNLITEFGKTNWTAWILGIAIVGIEFGFICVYRAGWKISLGNLIASISLACILLIIGMLFYKEVLTFKQIIGICVCVIGLILIAK